MTALLRPDSYARHTLERYTGSSVEDFGSYTEEEAELKRLEGVWEERLLAA